MLADAEWQEMDAAVAVAKPVLHSASSVQDTAQFHADYGDNM